MKKTRPTMSCPHCEGESLETFAGEYAPGDEFWYVACLGCGAEGPHGDTEEDACRLWDAKHASQSIARMATADGVAMLEDWIESPGAMLEFEIASAMAVRGLLEVRLWWQWIDAEAEAA